MKISRILLVWVSLLVFSILSLGSPLNADAALNAYLKLKEPMKLGATSSGYVLSGPDAEKAMQAINALKRDCCSCSKVGKEIICTWKKGTKDCCVNTLKALQKTIILKPTKPSAPTGMTISGSPPSAPKGLAVTGSSSSHPPPATGYTPEVPFTVSGQSPPRLVIRKSGNGTGTVTSSPPGINCGSTCTAAYNIGTDATLTATPNPGSSLFGRANPCFPEYTRECKVTVNTDKVIEIVFMQLVPVDTDSGICPIGYDCRSGNHERSFICSFNGDIDCYTPSCIDKRNCARTARDCVAMRNAGVDRNPDTDSLRLYFSYLCEY